MLHIKTSKLIKKIQSNFPLKYRQIFVLVIEFNMTKTTDKESKKQARNQISKKKVMHKSG